MLQFAREILPGGQFHQQDMRYIQLPDTFGCINFMNRHWIGQDMGNVGIGVDEIKSQNTAGF